VEKECLKMGFCGICECSEWGGEGAAGCGEMEVVKIRYGKYLFFGKQYSVKRKYLVIGQS